MQRAYPVSLYFKSRDRHIATLMSVSTADLKLPTKDKNIRLNIIPYYTIIPQGRTAKPSVE